MRPAAVWYKGDVARHRLRLLVVPCLALFVGAAGAVALLPGVESPGAHPAAAAAARPSPSGGRTAAAAHASAGATAPAVDSLVLPATPLDPSRLSGYVWPLAHGRITLPFGPTPWGTLIVDGQLFHDGVDMATFCGDRVVAAHAGTVLAAGQHFDQAIGWVGDLQPYFAHLDRYHAWGTLPLVVIVDDGDGFRAIYAHFGKIVVRPGQVVAAGQLLGYEGESGYATGCHLHFGLFSPLEKATFALRPDIVKRVKLPALEIARIDPLLVLPWPAPLGLGPGDRHPPQPPTAFRPAAPL